MTIRNKTARFGSTDFSHIRALCFDMDGTLSDTDDFMVERLARWFYFIHFLRNKDDSQILARKLVMAMENPGTYLHGLPDRLHIDHQIAKLMDLLSHWRNINKQTEPLPIIPGVKEMLERFKPHYLMAVVSARGRRNTLNFLDHYRITPFFKAIATGQTCYHTKPCPDPILWVAGQMNVLPSECLMIGDTTVDIQAGQAAGTQTVGVLCGFGEEEELRQAGANLILQNTTDLVEILLDSQPGSPD